MIGRAGVVREGEPFVACQPKGPGVYNPRPGPSNPFERTQSPRKGPSEVQEVPPPGVDRGTP